MIFLSGFRFSVNSNALDTFSHQKEPWIIEINTKKKQNKQNKTMSNVVLWHLDLIIASCG